MSQVPPPQAPQQPLPAKQSSGMGIASLVLGIVSFIICIPYLSLPAGIIGLVLGVLAKKKAAQTGGTPGLAKVGFILSIIGSILSLVILILAAVGFAMFSSHVQELQNNMPRTMPN